MLRSSAFFLLACCAFAVADAECSNDQAVGAGECTESTSDPSSMLMNRNVLIGSIKHEEDRSFGKAGQDTPISLNAHGLFADFNVRLSHQQPVKTCPLRQDTLTCAGASNCSEFPFDEAMRERAVTVPGHLYLWQRIHEKLCGGTPRPLKVLVLGGSVMTFPWVGTLCMWFKTVAPDSQCYPGGIDSCGSSCVFGLMNQSGSINQDIHTLRPDIILLETSVNPWPQFGSIPPWFPPRPGRESEYVEKIVRQALNYDWKPFIIAWEWMSIDDITSITPNFMSNQDYHTQVYNYYGIPVVSVRDVLWPHVNGRTDTFKGGPNNFTSINNEPYKNRADLKSWMTPSLEVTSVWTDGLHPTDQSGDIIVDVITGFFSEHFNKVGEQLAKGSIESPSELPPVLMTGQATNAMFGGTEDARVPVSVGDVAMGNSTGLIRATFNSNANLTARVTDMFTLLGLCSMLGWELLHIGPLANGVPGNPAANSQPPEMPMVGLNLLRVLSHSHIAVMHYFQRQPKSMATLIGFPLWAQWGWCWVQFFFVLSGFVLYLSQAGKGSEWHWVKIQRFLQRRLATLYPVFLLSITLTLMHPASWELARRSPGQLFSTICLVQTWMRPYGIELLNGPSWYLCPLVAFYLLFPRWNKQVKQSRQPHILLMFLWGYSWLLSAAAANLRIVTGRPAEQDLDAGLMTFLDFHPVCNWHLFVFGMVLAHCCCEWSTVLTTSSLMSFALITCPLCLLLCLFTNMQCPRHGLRVMFNKGALLLPVFSCLLVGFALEPPDTLTSLRSVVTWSAGAAWCLYILHMPLFHLFRGPLADHDITDPRLLVCFAIVIAAGVHTIYDKPMQHLLKPSNETM